MQVASGVTESLMASRQRLMSVSKQSNDTVKVLGKHVYVWHMHYQYKGFKVLCSMWLVFNKPSN